MSRIDAGENAMSFCSASTCRVEHDRMFVFLHPSLHCSSCLASRNVCAPVSCSFHRIALPPCIAPDIAASSYRPVEVDLRGHGWLSCAPSESCWSKRTLEVEFSGKNGRGRIWVARAQLVLAAGPPPNLIYRATTTTSPRT